LGQAGFGACSGQKIHFSPAATNARSLRGQCFDPTVGMELITPRPDRPAGHGPGVVAVRAGIVPDLIHADFVDHFTTFPF
jgi:hypothetical protein